MGQEDAGSLLRAAAAAAARKPSRSKSATGRGEGGMREGHDCFILRGGEEREEMENSFSDTQQLEEEFCVGHSMGAIRKWSKEETKRIGNLWGD